MNIKAIEIFMEEQIASEANHIQGNYALSPDLVGIRMYENPLIGVASAGDPFFETMRQKEVVGAHFMPPEEWLPEAKTVISLFFPFSSQVKTSNSEDFSWPSKEWLHARIEGQRFIQSAIDGLKEELTANGHKALVPSSDPKFKVGPGSFTSNWSERHVAFICGQGTFSLSKGLITKKGVAGRFASLVTDCELPLTPRNYEAFDQWCTYCGACIKNCPATAISKEKGKDHRICDEFLTETKIKENPRYGCGKCQVHVPCENRNPAAIHSEESDPI